MKEAELPLPKSRPEHLMMQIGWDREMEGHLLARKQTLLDEIAGLDAQIHSTRVNRLHLEETLSFLISNDTTLWNENEPTKATT